MPLKCRIFMIFKTTVQSMDIMKKGLVAGVVSNILFAVMYLYGGWMQPMNGTDVFAWRMTAMLGALCLVLWLGSGRQEVLRFVRETGKDWKKWLLLALPTPILASQLWLFMWGPLNGYGLDVAVGYFLFPLMMVLCGRLFLGEAVSRLQWLAVGAAACGVLYEIWHSHAFSWVTLWVFGTYPAYYLLRRHLGVPELAGLLVDLSAIAPVMLVYLVYTGGMAVWLEPSKQWLLIPLLGIISAAAMLLNLQSNRLLPVALFGMLSYLEPVLLFVLAATLLDAPVSADSIVTYGLIWTGLGLSMFDGYLKMRGSRSILVA